MYDSEVANAVKDVEIARNHLDWCDKEYIDTASFQLSAAMAKLNAIIRAKKSSSFNSEVVA